MLRAELHGKLSSKVVESEDVLTSAVFGFLEVAPRRVLRAYLKSALGMDVSVAEAEEAEFSFWRREYNVFRPHSSLGQRPPAPEVLLHSGQIAASA